MRPRRQHHLALAAAKSHAVLLKSGVSLPTPWNQLLTAYSAAFPPNSGLGLAAARRVFDEIPRPDAVSWNSLLAAHVAAGAHRDAWSLLGSMHARGLAANTFALGSALSSAAATRRPALGTQLQSFAIKSRLADNVFTASALLHVKLASAMDLFLGMERGGLVPDEATFATLLPAVEGPSRSFLMQQLHGKMVKYGQALGLVALNAAITSYSECGALTDSRKIFDGIDGSRDLISWNAMLGAYVYHGMDDEAMRCMQSENMRTDEYTFSAVLRSCSDLGILQLGKQIHSLIIQSGFVSNDFVSSSLIFMYAKSGILDDARKSFEEADKRSSVPWNSMIFGYAQHGQAHTVTNLFNEMLELEVPLGHVTFVGLITAYSHAGLVDKGSEILDAMETRYGVPLRMEHYACGVDLYGRAGHLDKAKELIESMPFKPDAMVWMTLLGSCRIHGNMELASDVASHLS
ncbi:hypothetical protein QOZ80_8BG0656730 [Eleusine coracana subsp. coracana]|nr:hypothetical protein QOZ80_8BG0656730 [Eleusine coracana subsp. coracana]